MEHVHLAKVLLKNMAHSLLLSAICQEVKRGFYWMCSWSSVGSNFQQLLALSNNDLIFSGQETPRFILLITYPLIPHDWMVYSNCYL